MNKHLLLIVTALGFLFACKKTENKNPLIEEARAFFETSVKPDTIGTPSTEGVKIILPEKEADWNKANVQNLRFGQTVVVPIRIPNHYTLDKLKAKQLVEQNAFLIVYKDKQNQKHAEVVIKIADENSREGAFAGIVTVLDWQGNLIQSYKVTYEKEVKLSTSIRVRQNGPTTETESLWCTAVDWYYCAQVAGYPAVCSYNYSTYYCFTENSSTPGSGVPPSSGSCCGSYGSITGGNNTYPLAKEIQCIKFDTAVKLVNVPTCIYNAFHTLREQRTGFWGKVIYDFADETPSFKWSITTGTTPAGKAAITNADPTGKITTTISNIYLSEATNISVARTMLHEAAHAFLVYKFTSQATQKEYPQLYQDYILAGAVTATAQHQEIARSFVNDIASILKVYGQGLGLQAYDTYYMDLAWGGLFGTTFFNALPTADKERITAINQAEATGESVTSPNGHTAEPLGTNTCN